MCNTKQDIYQIQDNLTESSDEVSDQWLKYHKTSYSLKELTVHNKKVVTKSDGKKTPMKIAENNSEIILSMKL